MEYNTRLTFENKDDPKEVLLLKRWLKTVLTVPDKGNEILRAGLIAETAEFITKGKNDA